MNREPSPSEREKAQNNIFRVGKMLGRRLEDNGVDLSTLEEACRDAITIDALTNIIKQRHQKPTEQAHE